MNMFFSILIYINYCKMTTAIILCKSNINENLRYKDSTLEEINCFIQLPEFENHILQNIFDIINNIDFKDIKSINNVYLKDWTHLKSLDFVIYDFVTEITNKVFIRLLQIKGTEVNYFLNKVKSLFDMFLANEKHCYEEELYYIAFEAYLYGLFNPNEVFLEKWIIQLIQNEPIDELVILKSVIIKKLICRKGCDASKQIEILFGTVISKHLNSIKDILDSKTELKKYENEKRKATIKIYEIINNAFKSAKEYIKENKYARKNKLSGEGHKELVIKTFQNSTRSLYKFNINRFFENKINKSNSNLELVEKIFDEKPILKETPSTSKMTKKEYKKIKMATAWIFTKIIKFSEIYKICVKEINLLYTKIETDHGFHNLILEKENRINVFLSVQNIIGAKKEHLEAIKTIFLVNFYKHFYINVREKDDINENINLFIGQNHNYIYKNIKHSTKSKIFTDLILLEQEIKNKKENFVKFVFVIESPMNLNTDCVINIQKSVQNEFIIGIKESVTEIYNFVEKIVTMFEFEQIEIQFLIKYISLSNILDLNELENEHTEDLLDFVRGCLKSLNILNNITTEEVINLYKKVSRFSFTSPEIKRHKIFDIIIFKKNFQQERKRYEKGLSTINLNYNANCEFKIKSDTHTEADENLNLERKLNIKNQESEIKSKKTLLKETEKFTESNKSIKNKKIKTKSSLPDGLVTFDLKKKQIKSNLSIGENVNIMVSKKNKRKNSKQKKEKHNSSEIIKQEENRILYTKIVKKHLIENKLPTYEYKSMYDKAKIQIKKESKRLKYFESKNKDITNFMVLNIEGKTIGKDYNKYSDDNNKNNLSKKTEVVRKIENKNAVDLICNEIKEDKIIPNINDYIEFPDLKKKKAEISNK